MEDSLQYIDIHKLRSLLGKNMITDLGDDFFVADIDNYDGNLSQLKYPCRFEGYLAFFCLSGDMKIDIDLNSYKISDNSLVINVPGNIVRVTEFDRSSSNPARFVLVAMSMEFMSSIKLDFGKLFNDSITIFDNPCISLLPNEAKVSYRYLDLVGYIIETKGLEPKAKMLSGLISSIFYFLGHIWMNRISAATESTNSKKSTRSKSTFNQFIKLVTRYHFSERNVAFYADKLLLTPKYLSKVVKTVSGRSAPDWIDSFVILEAKNMLKYSNMTIKGIVFKLHFVNQSVFYKFFKSHTGMTPSEYRNS
ncbi:MAG: helix-turn-helix domain-containing protein [Bacteroidales bacterium]